MRGQTPDEKSIDDTFVLTPIDHVPIANREIESRDHNAIVQIRAQSGKETEIFRLNGGYLARSRLHAMRARVRDVVMMTRDFVRVPRAM